MVEVNPYVHDDAGGSVLSMGADITMNNYRLTAEIQKSDTKFKYFNFIWRKPEVI